MRILLLICCILLSTIQGISQKHKEALQLLRDSFPQERIHIHFDKEVYMAGETIWFKAYMFSGFAPSDLSANFIVELVNDRNQVVMHKKLPVIAGTVNGNFDLPDTISLGNYTVRAYTPWMLNFDEAYIYRKAILIYKPSTSITNVNRPVYKFDLFPEGGDLVAGVVNVVAFKASDNRGMPATAAGKIVSEDGAEVATINTVHDGLGSFGFLPVAGQRYKADVEFGDHSVMKVDLPMAKESGWALQVREETETRRRIIIARSTGSQNAKLVLIGQMQQELVFEQSLSISGNNAMIALETKDYPSGIMQLTLLADGVPIAERLIFINNKEYKLGTPLQGDTLSVSKRAKNVLSFSVPDTLTGSYSVSVTDESRTFHNYSENDIVSSLLLTGDLKGYVHNPSFYLSNSDKSTRAALDLLMMTQGWRRFNWGDVLRDKFPSLLFRDQNYIQLSGTIYSAVTKKPVNDGEVNFILRTRDSLTDFFQSPVSRNGKFLLDNLVYADSAQFSFQLNSKRNKEKELYIQLDRDPVNFQVIGSSLLSKNFYQLPVRIPSTDSLNKTFGFATDTTGNYKLLESVIVTARKKRPIEELNERYTHGLFSSMNMVRILDLVNNEPGAGALNVFQYIQGRIGGLRVVSSGMPPTYTIYTGRAMSLTGGPIPVPIFLDEFPTTSLQLSTIPMNQIAMIKYFQTGFMGSPGTGSTQALVVYSKKNSDYKRDLRGYLNAFSYAGYSVVREFYSPNYEESFGANVPDRRSTLLWLPEVKIDPETGKYKIRFFNNDSGRRIRVVLEGFTADGKLIREEKIIE